MLEQGKAFHLTALESGPINCSFGCRAGGAYLAVGADGSLAPCSMFLETQGVEDAYRFGTVYEGLTDEIRRHEFLSLNAKRGKECGSCRLAPYCGGRCPATSYNATGCFVTSIAQQYRETMARSEFFRLIRETKKQNLNIFGRFQLLERNQGG